MAPCLPLTGGGSLHADLRMATKSKINSLHILSTMHLHVSSCCTHAYGHHVRMSYRAPKSLQNKKRRKGPPRLAVRLASLGPSYEPSLLGAYPQSPRAFWSCFYLLLSSLFLLLALISMVLINVEPFQHHMKIFLETVKNATLGSQLKSYILKGRAIMIVGMSSSIL